MKIMNYSDADAKQFEGDAVKGVTGRIAIGKADGAENFCMRVFEIQKNGYTPKHAHEWEHEIFFHTGKGRVLCGDQWQDVTPGSIAFIPGGMEHQIMNNGDSDLVFACLIPKGAPEI